MFVASMIALVALGHGQEVSFDAQGLTIHRAVARLGEELGLRLSVSPNIQNDLIVIRAVGVTSDALMAQIAKAASAEWRASSTGLILERTAKRENELHEASVAKRSGELNDYFEQVSRELPAVTLNSVRAFEREFLDLANSPSYREPSQEMDQLLARTPAVRLLHRIGSFLDSQAIVEMPYQARRVYALRPTALQTRFHGDPAENFRLYVEEQSLFASLASTVDVPERIGTYRNPFRSELFANMDLASLLVEVTQAAPLGPTTLSLQSVTASGTLTTLGRMDYQPKQGRRAPIVPGPPARPRPLAAYLLAVLLSQPVPTDLRLAREDLETLYDPEVNDALGLIANEAVRHAFPDGNIVAVLGDKQAVLLGHQLAMGASSAATRGYIEVDLDHRTVQEGDWTVLTPGDPYLVSSRQTPRNELKRVLREARASKSVSIENMAQLAAVTHAPSDAAKLTLLALGLSFPSQESDWSKLRFLGSLTNAQRNALMQGRFIQVSSLSASQRTALEECVVKENLMRLVSRPGDAPQKLTGDATVLLPRGLLANTSVSIKVVAEPSIVICHDNGYRVSRAYQGNPTLVAWIEMGRYSELAEKRAGYLMGSQRTLAINIDFGEGASQTYQLSGLEPDIEGKPSPWTELLPRIVEQIRNAMGGE